MTGALGREVDPVRLFAGWGGTSPSAARPARPDGDAAIGELFAHAGAEGRPLVARGLGRSYGDAAQCAGGTVVETDGLRDVEIATPVDGAVRVQAGTSLDTLMRALLPLGWFVPVTPGTRQVTVGGAIAADIHGKNHHRDGTFAAHVRSATLHTPTGTHEIGPRSDPELFWATAGGMGLTGIVSSATVALVPVESAYMVVDTRRADDLDEAVAALAEDDSRSRYTVAWIDCLARGRHLGRAVLTSGDHARVDALPARRRADPLRFSPRPGPRVPVTPPPGLLNPLTVAAFNEAWFR
ncbi:MAG TPA: FAD-binding oxidoreductase, partial [Acidimicrobiales bacterium]|nr:FAD-binding oxidoreductase [Acidimicrobiales bacterium]